MQGALTDDAANTEPDVEFLANVSEYDKELGYEVLQRRMEKQAAGEAPPPRKRRPQALPSNMLLLFET